MKSMSLFLKSIWTTCFLTVVAHGGEMRVFRSADGKPLKASFEGASGDKVILKREDGKVFEILLSKLSNEDQEFISHAANRAGDDAKKLNAAAGHPLSDGTPLSKRKAEDLAKELKIRPESESKYGRSWRLYAAFVKGGYNLFGTLPYSLAIYSNPEGYVSSISAVYANKGDFGSKAGFGKDHFKGGTSATAKTLGEAMSQDEATVTKALSSVFGPGAVQRYGEGKTRRTVTRWDWNDHSFLLSNEEGEYVGLSIVPISLADAGGKSVISKDAEVKDRLKNSLVKADNGDVSISHIPMVNQGPKGYCVPATFERAMRTMGLDADMYLLAMVGESQAGGGTSVDLLVDNLKHQVLSKGRRVKNEDVEDLRIRDIKRYIDEGIPIMWRMCSMEEYNKIADKNTDAREKITDWKAYATKIATENANLAKSDKPSSNHHLCMIIGYNEATQEVAVSDSWGNKFEKRWVPISVANWVHNGQLVMILP
jgi:hypothetical protein